MSGVDDRVVSMTFDNASFEKKLSETIASLNKLTQSLNMTQATKGLDELSQAGHRFNLGSIGSAAEGVSGKFLAMATVGITALANITTKAISAGAQVVKSLTIAPVLDGFREYELKMGSIQTILANTSAQGTTLDQVTGSLDELNKYADKTIYNFGAMTKNIGLFTNAGIGIDDATSMIKGFSNAAAASGTSAEGAAGAAYQLSQALSAGTIRLMDWRSLTNVGMGNKNMQNGLIEIADAMGTLNANGTSATEIQGNFNASLEKNWLSADVMSTYLKIMAGDMSDAEIAALGLSEESVKAFRQQQIIAEEAATKVRTFTQLMGTLKESVGSGWAETFDIVFGNFDQATELFTEISTVLGYIVGQSTEARNSMLQGWADFGGRTALIDALRTAFFALLDVLNTIKDAFREFFPATTAADLLRMTAAFADFTEKLKMGDETLNKVKNVFRGFFALLDIGWEIIKGVVSVIGDLLSSLSGAGGGLLDLGSNAGLSIVKLHELLVEGGAIKDFFDDFGGVIQNIVGFFKDFKDNVVGLFDGFEIGKITEISTVTGRVVERVSFLSAVFERLGNVFDWLAEKTQGIRNVLGQVAGEIADFLGNLGEKIVEAFDTGNFDAVFDALNIGLLAGIVLTLRKFLKNGLNINLGASVGMGQNGFLTKLSGIFDQLTSTLKAMQAEIKAKALLKIAAAVAILTASIVVLSLIDSAALTKALTAITVSFGLLLGTMALIDKFDMGTNAVKLNGVAASMILLAAAVGVLSLAIQNLSDLSWDELARGLTGTAVAMGLLVAASHLISTDSAGMIRAGAALLVLSAAIVVLSIAIEAFSGMEWSEIAQGLAGVAASLGAIALGMNLMPTNMALTAPALIAVAIAMRILFESVEAFSGMDWGEMGKGIGGVALTLAGVGLAMQLMPLNLPITAAGLILVAIAMRIMAESVEKFGGMDMGELAKGIGAIAAMLAILAVGLTAMIATLPGAAALVVASAALVILVGVLRMLGGMSIGEIATGLGGIAAVLVVLGGAALIMAPIIPALLALGIALGIVGVAFALFGVGALLVARAIEIMSVAGITGIKAFVEGIKLLIMAIPEILDTIIQALIDIVKSIVDIVPELLSTLGELLGAILDFVVANVPRIAEAFGELIPTIVGFIREHFPTLLALGLEMFLNLLQGIRDNIYEITTVVIDIIDNMARALDENMQRIVDIALTLLFGFLDAIAARVGDIVAAGTDLILAFLLGITNQIGKVLETATLIIITILTEIADSLLSIVQAGYDVLTSVIRGVLDNIQDLIDMVVEVITTIIDTLADAALDFVAAGFKVLTDVLQGVTDNIQDVIDTVGTVISTLIQASADLAGDLIAAGLKALTDFLQGVLDNLQDVIDTIGEVVTTFITAVGDLAEDITQAGLDALTDFLDGIGDNLINVTNKIGEVIAEFIKTAGDKAEDIARAGAEALVDFLEGIGRDIQKVIDKGVEVARKFIEGVGNASLELANAAANALVDFLNGLADAIERQGPRIRGAGWNIAEAIVTGMVSGFSASRLIGQAVDAAVDIARRAWNAVMDFLDADSPSKLFVKVGGYVVQGFAQGLENTRPVESSMTSLGNAATEKMQWIVRKLHDDISGAGIGLAMPVITPVLDLTEVRRAARGIDDMMRVSNIRPDVSYATARHISTTTDLTATPGEAAPYDGPTELNFEQNIYAPEALSTADIYRNTKSQIALAKEELKIA